MSKASRAVESAADAAEFLSKIQAKDAGRLEVSTIQVKLYMPEVLAAEEAPWELRAALTDIVQERLAELASEALGRLREKAAAAIAEEHRRLYDLTASLDGAVAVGDGASFGPETSMNYVCPHRARCVFRPVAVKPSEPTVWRLVDSSVPGETHLVLDLGKLQEPSTHEAALDLRLRPHTGRVMATLDLVTVTSEGGTLDRCRFGPYRFATGEKAQTWAIRRTAAHLRGVDSPEWSPVAEKLAAMLDEEGA